MEVRMMKKSISALLCITALLGFLILNFGCMPKRMELPVVPSIRYVEQLEQEQAMRSAGRYQRSPHYAATLSAEEAADSKGRLQFVNNETSRNSASSNDSVGNLDSSGPEPKFYTYESTDPDVRDYNGPLSLGDPGLSASLWKESSSDNDLFHDHRAFRPMDLITIIVSESSEGSKEADTEVKESSTVSAAIENFLNFEEDATQKNSGIDLANLINAQTTNDYKGEGETNRKGSLTAKISAMVAEVLPSGILRVEGEKIISVNNEEQVMILSGLVRPRDINSQNEIDSSKIANMRVDYFGKGTVGEAQSGGWLGRIVRKVWPF